MTFGTATRELGAWIRQPGQINSSPENDAANVTGVRSRTGKGKKSEVHSYIAARGPAMND